MKLSNYLVGRRLVTREEIKKLLSTQFYESVGFQTCDDDGFQNLAKTTDEPLWTTVRHPPFGDVLARLPDILELVLKRAGVASLPELVEMWHRDVIREMECLGHYSPGIRCAANLYRNRLEKKIVARYVATSKRVGAARTMLSKGEKVALLEGSSGFFVAMAAAAQFSTCTVISSNGILNAEYFHNPCIAKSFSNFHAVGGKADFSNDSHTPEHAGVYGHDAEFQFQEDMRRDPGATTLVVPCSGFLPETGPLATTGDVVSLKTSVMRSAIEVGVHQILFVIDYSKMLPSRAQTYGVEVFSGPEWKNMLRDHGEQITLVTTPPTVLRDALAEQHYHPGNRKKLSDLYPDRRFTNEDLEYNQVAAQFLAAFGTKAQFHEALFVEPDGIVKKPLIVTEAAAKSNSN